MKDDKIYTEEEVLKEIKKLKRQTYLRTIGGPILMISLGLLSWWMIIKNF
jgi:hypothetical protein